MFYSCIQLPVNVEINMLASKRSELIGNTAIVRKRSVIHKKGYLCVLASVPLRLPIAASCSEAQGRPVASLRRVVSYNVLPQTERTGLLPDQTAVE